MNSIASWWMQGVYPNLGVFFFSLVVEASSVFGAFVGCPVESYIRSSFAGSTRIDSGGGGIGGLEINDRWKKRPAS